MRKQALTILTIFIICFVSACGLKSDLTEKSIYHQVSEFQNGTKVFIKVEKDEPEPQLVSAEGNTITVNWNNNDWKIIYVSSDYEKRKAEIKDYIYDDYGSSFIGVYDGDGEAAVKLNPYAYVKIPFSNYSKAKEFASHVSFETEGISVQMIPPQV